jgi:hypothetical protein
VAEIGAELGNDAGGVAEFHSMSAFEGHGERKSGLRVALNVDQPDAVNLKRSEA